MSTTTYLPLIGTCLAWSQAGKAARFVLMDDINNQRLQLFALQSSTVGLIHEGHI
jgi:hypothetical protein